MTTRLANVPNIITAIRLVLSIVVFALIAFDQFFAAMLVFILAASTDWIDGYWARKFNQVTKVGRVFDPFVDKVIICGTFVFLAAEAHSGIAPWMAVVVMGREMLVTGLRSFIEQAGGDFSASFSGKLKMLLQCIAVGASLLALHFSLQGSESIPTWLSWTVTISVWIAMLSTVQSGVEYIFAAARYFRE